MALGGERKISRQGSTSHTIKESAVNQTQIHTTGGNYKEINFFNTSGSEKQQPQALINTSGQYGSSKAIGRPSAAGNKSV